MKQRKGKKIYKKKHFLARKFEENENIFENNRKCFLSRNIGDIRKPKSEI